MYLYHLEILSLDDPKPALAAAQPKNSSTTPGIAQSLANHPPAKGFPPAGLFAKAKMEEEAKFSIFNKPKDLGAAPATAVPSKGYLVH